MHRKSVYCLLLAVAALIVIGCVMLFSTSAFAQDKHSDPNFFIKRQFMWLAVGFVACVIASKVDYHFWRGAAWVLYGASAVFLLLCFVPGIGKRLNGSARWLNLGVASFQPSEFAKLAVVCVLAWWFSREQTDARSFWKGFVAPLAIAGGLMALIAPEVDMGTTALIGATAFTVMFIAGTRVSFIAPIFAAGLGGMLYVARHIGERQGRLMAFMDLEKFKEGAGLQQWQALIAFGSGGVEGLGLGNGRQKMAYLPYAHTDFIFPMIGEELGLRCTLLVVFCFIVIILCGVVIALRARDRFGLLLGFGIIMLIALQAAVNIGVTTALLPNKGLPLPFISYGGSNLAFCMLCVGIVINIYRQGISEKEGNRSAIKLMASTAKRKRPVRI
jgi:cell division protein FtsW